MSSNHHHSMEGEKRVVLVTGGAGFIGCNTADALLKQKYHVVVLDLLTNFYDPRQKLENLQRLKSTAESVDGSKNGFGSKSKVGQMRSKAGKIQLDKPHMAAQIF